MSDELNPGLNPSFAAAFANARTNPEVPKTPEQSARAEAFADRVTRVPFVRRVVSDADRFGVSGSNLIGFDSASDLIRALRESGRLQRGERPLSEIEARAATSRYWARRVRWLRRRRRA